MSDPSSSQPDASQEHTSTVDAGAPSPTIDSDLFRHPVTGELDTEQLAAARAVQPNAYRTINEISRTLLTALLIANLGAPRAAAVLRALYPPALPVIARTDPDSSLGAAVSLICPRPGCGAADTIAERDVSVRLNEVSDIYLDQSDGTMGLGMWLADSHYETDAWVCCACGQHVELPDNAEPIYA